MELLQSEELKCHHCGDVCDDSIRTEEHVFCCYGCKAVHELLENSNLRDYYDETSLENKSISQLKAERKYSFLDNSDIQRQLLSFQNETISVIRFFLPGIHCSSCIYLLEQLPGLDQRILRAEVNFIKKEVNISFLNQEMSLKALAVLLSQLGYPPGISLDSIDKTKKHVSKSNLGIKIAVAGFCFGNAMLMSMPEYLDHNFLLTDDFKNLFGWINLVLAFPVLLFSASDYFEKAWKGILSKNLNIDVPIALGILTLFGRSVFEIVTQTGGGYVDSLAGLVFFLLIGKWYQSKSYQALSFERDYTSYFPVSVTCMIDGEEFDRPIKELKKGDVIVVHNDELIPADGTIVEGSGNIDYSFVTGESKPDEVKKNQMVYAGGRQKGGELVIKLEQGVDTSELTQLWNADVFKKDQATLQTWVDKVSKYFTAVVIFIAVATSIYWWLNGNTDLVWNASTAVLIVACPCALALVLPFAYGHAMRLFGNNGLYLKNAEVIESLASVDHLVFDKTGTLTSSGSSVKYEGRALSTEDIVLLRTALANSAHPLSRIIYNDLPVTEKLPIESFEEHLGQGFRALIADNEVTVGSASFLNVPVTSATNESKVHISINGYVGYFSIQSAYREGIFDMLQSLGPHYKMSLLSGDNDSERTKLGPYFDKLLFSQKPMDKLNFLKEKEGAYLMVGDGLNDAGALKRADVGIAVSEDIHQFSPACDAILGSNSITKIPNFLSFSKSVKSIVFVAFGISFLYNIVGLSFAVTGHLTPLISAILMPISSVTVVAFVSLMVIWKNKKDGVGSLAANQPDSTGRSDGFPHSLHEPS